MTGRAWDVAVTIAGLGAVLGAAAAVAKWRERRRVRAARASLAELAARLDAAHDAQAERARAERNRRDAEEAARRRRADTDDDECLGIDGGEGTPR